MDFHPDNRYVKAFEYTAELEAYIGEVASLAAESAKIEFEAAGPHRFGTGDYVDSLKGYAEMTGRGVVGYVLSDDFKAVWLEYGTGGDTPTPAFSSLQRGCNAIGLLIRARP